MAIRPPLTAALLLPPLAPSLAITPGDPGPGHVRFSIDAAGPAQPISPLIYGINGSTRPSGLTGVRLGGNRWTGYNWETNNSNAGEDFFHVNDEFLTNSFGQITPPGEAVGRALTEAANLGAATNVTVPMAGYASADANGTVTPAQTAPSSRWHEIRTRKSSVYPGVPLSTSPDLNDDYVFSDEFVNWVEANRVGGQQVNYLLDNEPSLWDDTHPYLWGTTGPTFAEVGARSIDTASAIKDTAPGAKVSGGVTFGWSGMQSLQDAPDFLTQVASDGGRQLDKLQFNRWLLKEFAEAEQTQGRTLMDALDVHWYPEAQGAGVRITAGGEYNTSPAVVEARVQAPRSLWDPTYFEDSYITRDILRDYSGQGNDQAVELLNRIRSDIDELKPGTLISVSEYNYGGGQHISGGVAQADVLGVFGREGVWNASWWPIEGDNNAPFVEAAFEMYTNFDGAGGRFGDLSVVATTDDIAATAVYASRSTTDANELIVVAINRTDTQLDAAITLDGDRLYQSAEAFVLTDAAAAPTAAGSIVPVAANAFNYAMPAYSVTTLRLVAAPGDFDGDGDADTADYAVWQSAFGDSIAPGTGPDANADGTVDAADYTIWRDAQAAAASAVPEPRSTSVAVTAALAAIARRSRSYRRRVA